ncbi:MAG: hypothetical protein NTX88_01550 [Candidatus Atribacteria bacterium]|nr:hypothetical protein [Candidatus Atribacteria bacterium]
MLKIKKNFRLLFLQKKGVGDQSLLFGKIVFVVMTFQILGGNVNIQ